MRVGVREGVFFILLSLSRDYFWWIIPFYIAQKDFLVVILMMAKSLDFVVRR